MKFCSKCGKELVDEAVVCTGCGCAIESVSKKEEDSNKELGYGGLGVAAQVFAIIGTVVLGLWIFPLAWCLPMTIIFCSKVNKGEKIGVGFKVCMLLFVSLLGGIFALCMGEPQPKK